MTIAYDRRGSGPPLVLLHPLGADRTVWAPVLPRLAVEREVICVDLPGFGESPPLRGDCSPPALAAAVADFLGEQGISGAAVAGNSLGGWVALELALAGAARSVVGIAPAGLWPQPLRPKRGVARKLARAVLPILPLLARSTFGRRLGTGGTMAHPERVPPAEVERLVRSYATAPGFAEVNAAMRASRFTGLEHVRVPVTLAWCEHDRLVAEPAHVPPTVRTVRLAGCGHVPMWDDPDRVAQLLLGASGT